MSKKANHDRQPHMVNKNARRNFELMEKFEAGLSLMGSEVKSLREGRVSFKDGYIRFKNGEAYLSGVHIAPYENAGPPGHGGHEPERDRKLLLHGHEIRQLANQVEQKGLTVVPVRIYFTRGKAKLEIAVARGKKLHDHRETLKRKAVQRDMEREMSRV
ncbi:MAG: SsrA-binding protein SmpB [Desulfovibrio sp.]|nr:MAG: SsrA-binding protein SmpB [Desulfovibrio sp.]